MSRDTRSISMETQLQLLKRENELLNSIVQGASDSIYAKDLDGRYITINEAGASFFSTSIENVIGKTDRELIGEKADSLWKKDQELFRTGEKVMYETQNFFNGEQHYFWTSKSPIKDANGSIIGLVGVSRNISQAKYLENKYRFIFDNAPVAFWEEDFSEVKLFLEDLKRSGVTDIAAHFRANPKSLEECIRCIKVLNVNKATLEMNGATDKTQFIARLQRNFTPESEDIFIEEFVALADGQTEFHTEGGFVNQKGEVLDVLFHLNVMPGHEESLSMVLVSVIDVTDTHNLANELNTIKHRYQSIVEAQSEMICRMSPTGNILFRNLAFTRFFSFKLRESQAWFSSLFPPDELERAERWIQELQPANPNGNIELRNYDEKGNLVWQEWSISAFFAKSGVLLGHQAVGTDVTTRKMAEEAMAASEARWRSVFDNADDLIMTVNSEGYVLSVNDYREVPGSKKWAGRRLSEVLVPVNAKAITELIDQVFVGGEVIKTELKVSKPQGGFMIFGVALSPIFSGKRVISVVCIARNITETKAFENSNREALIEGEEKERLRVSQELHDGLGQLFTAIKLNLQQIKTGLGDSPQDALVNGVDMLEANIDVAINEVKNISRNLMPDVLWQFGLEPAIEDLVAKLNSTTDMSISLETVDISQRFPAEVEKAVFRMCQELLNNAIRHGKAKSTIVQLINHGDMLVLIIEDDGAGFNIENVQMGFGLRNIRSRVEVFGGTVEFDSRPGKGTHITVEIPLK